jgi:hypothetical protein
MTDTFVVAYSDQNIAGTYAKDGPRSYMKENKLAKIEMNDSYVYHVFTRPDTSRDNWDYWNAKIKLVNVAGQDYKGTWWIHIDNHANRGRNVDGFRATLQQAPVPDVKAADPVVPHAVPLAVPPAGSSSDLITQYRKEASDASQLALSNERIAQGHKEATLAAKNRVAAAKTEVDAVKTRVQNAKASVDGVSYEVDTVRGYVDQAATAEHRANNAYIDANIAATEASTASLAAHVTENSTEAQTAARQAKAAADRAQTAKDAAGTARQNAEGYASSAGDAVERARSAAETAIAAVQPPVANTSRTTLTCEDLLPNPANDASIVVCAQTGTSSSVSIKRDDENQVSVVVYKRNTGEWGGYAPIDTQVLKGVYVLIDKSKKTVTCVWQYNRTPGHETIVYEARLIDASTRTYALTQTHPVPAAAAQTTVSITVSQEVADSLPAPTQEQINVVACAALGSKFTGEELKCPPPVGARADVAIVTVTKSGFTAQFNLYKYTQPASFWAGYGRAANSGAPTGVYVKISSTGDVTCVWDSGASGQKVEYKSERVPSASTSTSVYTLTSGTDNVTLVHDSGPSPFPTRTPKEAEEDKKKEEDLAEKTAAACNELKAKLNLVVCGSTSTVTSTVMVMRGTAAGVPVTLHYDVPSRLWTGYGLSTGSAGTGPKGLYVAVSIDAQGVAIVKCVWDTNPAEVRDYRATLQDRTARMYALVDVSPTSVVKDTVSVLVTSDRSPFPSEQETPKPVAPAPAPSSLSTEAIIGIVVGSVVGFILIVVLVLWVRSRKAHGQLTNWNNFQWL